MSQLNTLCYTPEYKRDLTWERQFLDAFVQGRVELLSEEPQQGPDGWPYMFVRPTENESDGEPVLALLDWLKDKGIGLVVNPNKELPDFIFTFGMIWNFAERNLLIEVPSIESQAIKAQANETQTSETQTSDPLTSHLPKINKVTSETEVIFSEGESIYFGCPSKEFLPPYIANILLEFFEQQGVDHPKVAIIGKDSQDFDLCFSLESMGNPPEKEHQGVLEAISWFLPTHYSLMLISEESVSEFYELKKLATK